jgi:hypothetical protein
LTLILISTSCRHTEYNEPSGRLLVFDVEKGGIIRSCEIIEPPYRESDPNPRGGFRGFKGISIDGDKIAIANASTIFLYDQFWNPLYYVWHPSCAGIHEIKLHGNLVWATSSRNDLLICLNNTGNIVHYFDIRQYSDINQFSPRTIKPFLTERQIIDGEIDFRDPRTHDNTITDAFHINSFTFLSNGDLLISCGLFRRVSEYWLHQLNNRLKLTGFSEVLPKIYHYYKKIFGKTKTSKFEAKTISKEVSISLLLRVSNNGIISPSLKLSGCTVPSHSIQLLNDHSAIYLNTTTGEIIHFNPDSSSVYSSTPVGKKFLRGALQLPDGSLLLGDNNELIHFNMSDRKIISKTLVSENQFEAIFDVNFLPENFDLPPHSFVSLHNDRFPVNQCNQE